MKEFDYPELVVWFTSTGRADLLPDTVESWINHCTYPNYRIILLESQMTDESREFFKQEYIDGEATATYLATLPARFPHINMEIIVQPYRPLGQVYDQLLAKTGDYFINLEDDLITVCDPHDQIVDAIQILRADPKALGMRVDLRDETVFEYCPRFPRVGYSAGMKYAIIDTTCSGGAQVMDATKTRAIGGYCTSHAPKDYIQTELQQSAAMRSNKMFTAVNLKYWGFLKHMGHHGVQGGDRSWTIAAYNDLEKHGWFGDGKNRTPREHPREWYIRTRVENGLP
mgnify:CR=1 FL=1